HPHRMPLCTLQVDVSCARSRVGSQVVAGKTRLKLLFEITQPVQPLASSSVSAPHNRAGGLPTTQASRTVTRVPPGSPLNGPPLSHGGGLWGPRKASTGSGPTVASPPIPLPIAGPAPTKR